MISQDDFEYDGPDARDDSFIDATTLAPKKTYMVVPDFEVFRPVTINADSVEIVDGNLNFYRITTEEIPGALFRPPMLKETKELVASFADYVHFSLVESDRSDGQPAYGIEP